FVHFTSLFPHTSPSPTSPYTLSLHDALPISARRSVRSVCRAIRQRITSRRRTARARRLHDVSRRSEARLERAGPRGLAARASDRDRKSTRLNSSHSQISYAVFCLKKKKNIQR